MGDKGKPEKRREGGCEDERARKREERDSGMRLSEESEQSAKLINNQLTGITK